MNACVMHSSVANIARHSLNQSTKGTMNTKNEALSPQTSRARNSSISIVLFNKTTRSAGDNQ